MHDDSEHHLDDPDGEEPEESFADLLESYSAGMKDDLGVGDKVRGKIIAISDNAVFVDTGTKADGIVELEELKDDEGLLPYEVGDEVEMFVVAATESEIRLSKAIAGIGGLSMLQNAHANNIPVQGKVVKTIKGGFQVDVLQRRAFCPISQIDTQYVEDAEAYVGQAFAFRISRLTEGGRNIVLSRRDLLEAEQRKASKAFMRELAVDQVHSGRVTRLLPYGAFVELIAGVEGMVHISELSWSRVEKPEDAVSVGEEIKVQVLRIEPGDKKMKIALSVRQVTGDPWERVDQHLVSGQKVTGTVTRCAPFGAFVELHPGIEGLVHISEMSYTKRVLKAEEIVQSGQSVSVLIKDIDATRRRISLSIRDAEGDPWLDVNEKFTVGQPVRGTVEKREQFGLFILLEPGIVGLLPMSVIKQAPQASRIANLKPGADIDVNIAAIRSEERKISLGLGAGEDETQWRQFVEKSQKSSGSGLGSLGEMLSAALKNKPQ